MNWLTYAVIAALISAGKRPYEKKMTEKFQNLTIGFIIQAFSIIPTIVLVFACSMKMPADILHLSWKFWVPLIVVCCVYPFQFYFYYESLRIGNMSHVTPIISILPVFNMFSSMLLLHEFPTRTGGVGIVIMGFGTYLSLIDKKDDNGKITYHRSIIFMILAAACMAFTSSLDKVATLASSPGFYSMANTFVAGIVFLSLIAQTFSKRMQRTQLIRVSTKLKGLLILGVFQAISFTFTLIAYTEAQTSYTLALRSVGFLAAIVIGVFWFKEPFTKRNAIALVCFILGTALISGSADYLIDLFTLGVP